MKYSDYKIIKQLGEGGNAIVELVEDPDHNRVALKKLKDNSSRERKERFKYEIDVLKKWSNTVDGIIPIFDYSVSEYWYTMPIATPVMQHIFKNELSPDRIVDYFIELCQTMSTLHNNGISHRDIKPNNIYYYKERFFIGDFGLVDFPDRNKHFTRSDRKLGALFTIAPEMLRNPKNADGKKADVYSLAKTLWMLLSLNEKGFDGQYNYFDQTHSLNKVPNLKGIHLIEIEELIKDSTSNNPNDRPTIEGFITRLQNWKCVFSDFDKQQKSQWAFLYKNILHDSGDSVTWRNLDEIIETLNKISVLNAFNHMFFPDGGGQDFVSAKRSQEVDGIEIWDDMDSCRIVCPKALHFESFPENEEWNYFFLELKKVEKVFDTPSICEELVEDTPGHYVEPTYYQYGVYDYETGKKYPDGYRLVCRYTEGNFLFVLKNGPYNQINSTYDARHNDCSNEQFRDYISELIDQCPQSGEEKQRFYNSLLVNDNPFKKGTVEKVRSKSYNDIITCHSISEDKYYSTNFSIPEYGEKHKNEYAKFYISFNPNNGKQGFGLEEIRLCKDGFLQKMEFDNYENVLFFDDRKIAHQIKHCLEEQLFNGSENAIFSFFTVHVIGISKPEHLVTREEIENLMRKADDRVHNTLVIDEKGYAKIICNNELDVNSFPVRHEKWDAGNMYVGKYSDLSTLNDTYLSSLYGWLCYLETKKSIHVDFWDKTKNEKELKDEIEKVQ